MKSMKYLEKEKRLIEPLLEILDYFFLRLENGKDVPPYILREIIELLHVYTKTLHATREKAILEFPGTRREDALIQECGQIHAGIKKYAGFLLRVNEAYDLGYQGARSILSHYGKQYVQTLRRHFAFESELLEKLVGSEERRDSEILKQFRKLDGLAKKTRERHMVRIESLKRESRRVTAH